MTALEQTEIAIAAVGAEFAPDRRVAIFEIAASHEEDGVAIGGATSEWEALRALHRRLALLDGGTTVCDRVVRLPAPDDGEPHHALVRTPLAPMLAEPYIAAAAVSQQVLGMHLLVLRRREHWLHCRSDDGYLGWVHRGYVNRVDEIGARAWKIGTHGEVCFSLGAELHDERGRVLTQLPWGARFISEEDGTARLPEGTTGYVAGDMVRATERAARFPTDGVAMVRTAAEWIGTPYIWSGITPAGADCSGFAQAVWRMHGVLLPRDSDLQALAGIAVEPGPDFSNLVAGDLLFFEEIPGRITHVTISLGGARIIHSSLGNGGVRCNDLAGDTGFERNLRSIFVCARRVNPLGTA